LALAKKTPILSLLEEIQAEILKGDKSLDPCFDLVKAFICDI